MQGIAKPVGGGHAGKAGKPTPASTKELNRRLHDAIRRAKGLPLDYERGKDTR